MRKLLLLLLSFVCTTILFTQIIKKHAFHADSDDDNTVQALPLSKKNKIPITNNSSFSDLPLISNIKTASGQLSDYKLTGPWSARVNIEHGCSVNVFDIDYQLSGTGNPVTVKYRMEGSTNGNGTGSVSGLNFNKGSTWVMYYLEEDTSVHWQFYVTAEDKVAPSVLNTQPIEVNSNPNDNGTIVTFDDPTWSDNCSKVMDQFVLIGTYNNHTYFKSTGNYSWLEAAQLARSLGGQLAVITEEAENSLIYNSISTGETRGIYNYWINLNDTAFEGTFNWGFSRWPETIPANYTNWEVNEPSNTGDNEDATEIYTWNGKWNDNNIEKRQPFILEFESLKFGPLPTPTMLKSGDFFSKGTYTNTYMAADESRNMGLFTQTISVKDAQPGVSLNCSSSKVVPANAGACSTIVSNLDPILSPVGSTAKVNYKMNGATIGSGTGSVSGMSFNTGITKVTYTLDDKPTQTCSFTITVTDTEAPTIMDVVASMTTLWPPNHEMKDVTLSYKSNDNCSVVRKEITISSNESENGSGDGNTENDWEVVNENLIKLRAERSGNGSGRIYTITINVWDAAGNTSSSQVMVSVPKSMGNIKGSKLYSALANDVKELSVKNLTVKTLPNPSTSCFTLIVQSNINTLASLRVLDAAGRVVETKSNIAVNNSLLVGHSYRPGVYYVEVMQGGKKVTLKLIKQL